MIWFLSCQETSVEQQEVELASASMDVTFASVEKLGPHRYEALIKRSELQGERLESEHTEFLKIDWLNWDNFHIERRVDGVVVQNVCVIDHVAWKYRGEKNKSRINKQEKQEGRQRLKNDIQQLNDQNSVWTRRPDAEPYRVELRSSWNSWEQLLVSFQDDLLFRPTVLESSDGRRVQQYALDYTPPEASKHKLVPRVLSGEVWLDELTAVRLFARVEGERAQAGYRQQFSLDAARTLLDPQAELEIPISLKQQLLLKKHSEK